MAWNSWLRGLVVALATGGLTALTALAVLKNPPSGWELFLIAGIPMGINFFSFLKQTPLPIGGSK